MKNITITLSKDNISTYLETSTTVSEIQDVEVVNIPNGCLKFFNKILDTLKLCISYKKVYKAFAYTLENGHTYYHFRINKTSDTRFLFTTFEKLGMPISTLAIECDSTMSEIHVSNLLLRNISKLSEPQKVQILMYLLSLLQLMFGLTFEKVSISSDGLFTITVRHSNSFTSVFSNLDYSYLDENSTVFMNIPIGYSKNQSNACLYSNDTLLTNYLIDGDYIVWQN